jgi:hypothetical protein
VDYSSDVYSTGSHFNLNNFYYKNYNMMKAAKQNNGWKNNINNIQVTNNSNSFNSCYNSNFYNYLNNTGQQQQSMPSANHNPYGYIYNYDNNTNSNNINMNNMNYSGNIENISSSEDKGNY